MFGKNAKEKNASRKKKFEKNYMTALKALLKWSAVLIIYICFCLFIFSIQWEKEYITGTVYLILPFFGIFLIIFRNAVYAYICSTAAAFAMYYSNESVFEARRTPIVFSDIYCVSDAARVISHYTFPFSQEIAIKFAVMIIGIIVFIFAGRKIYKTKNYNCWIGGGIVIFSLAMIRNITTEQIGFNINNFTEKNGLPLALYSEYKQSVINEPEGYSKSAVEEIEAKYHDDPAAEYDNEEAANVIVIMNEAFSDYNLMGKTEFKKDSIPFIHSLKDDKNCKQGKMYVSVKGGYTCNTEFEFLSGASCSFLPKGALPYMQYMNKNITSIAKDLSKLGYAADAIHPYFAQEWRRTDNYKLLGFDKFTSGELFSEEYQEDKNIGNITSTKLKKVNFGDDLEYIRGFISDRECYKKAEEIMEENAANGKAQFIFAVTVQNHGGYDYEGDDFSNYEYCDSESLNQYLTLTSISDEAFEELINKISEYDKKTIVLMFGDHQPSIKPQKYFKRDTAYSNGFEENSDLYTVPYILWANYDIEWESGDMISPNYLSAVLKKNAGFPLSAWDKIRLEAMKKYPVLTANFAADAQGNFCEPTAAAEDESVRDYMIYQYKMMFDE